MAAVYIEQRGEGYYFVGSRVSLDSVVYEFLQGEAPEAIAQSFPSLTLEQIYGGITHYLANRSSIDEYLGKAEAKLEALRQKARAEHPLLYRKLDQALRESLQRH